MEAPSPGSWHSSQPGTAPELSARIAVPIKPRAETYAQYESRLARQVEALRTLGVETEPATVERLLALAAYAVRLHTDATDLAAEVKLLRREYAAELLDEDNEGEPKRAARISALEQLLKERGVDAQNVRARVGTPQESPSPAKKVAGDEGFVMESVSRAESDLDGLRRRLEQAEIQLAAQRLQANTPQGAGLEAVLLKQSELLAAAIREKERPQGTIRVEPRVQWPRLGDDGPGGKEVEEFYDKLEEIFGLANNGRGMSWSEQIGRAHV